MVVMGYREEDNALTMCLQLLRDECSEPEYKGALQTLAKMFRNIVENPTIEKYRSLRKENKTFQARVWRWEAAREFMLAAGWCDIDECLTCVEDDDIAEALAQLEKQLGSSEKAATESAAISWTKQEESDKDKRIAEERKRQLQKVKRDKEEKKRISEQIKEDRRESGSRPSKESKATKVNFGAKVTNMKDMGINQGG